MLPPVMGRWEQPLRLAGIGWYIALCILLGVLGGWWLDGRLHTKPIFVIVGLILGLVLAVYGAYRMLVPLAGNKPGNGDSR